MAIKISTAKIKKEWTDYNGHMNVAYYILIFDQNAAETLMTKLDMGEKSALETNKSKVYTVDENTPYLSSLNRKVSSFEVAENYFRQIGAMSNGKLADPTKKPWSGAYISYVVTKADKLHYKENTNIYKASREYYNPKSKGKRNERKDKQISHPWKETFSFIKSGGHSKYSDYALWHRLRSSYSGWYLLDISRNPDHKIMLGNIVVKGREVKKQKFWKPLAPVDLLRASHGDVVWKIEKVGSEIRAYTAGGNVDNTVRIYRRYFVLNDDHTIKQNKDGYVILLQKIIKKPPR